MAELIHYLFSCEYNGHIFDILEKYINNKVKQIIHKIIKKLFTSLQ